MMLAILVRSLPSRPPASHSPNSAFVSSVPTLKPALFSKGTTQRNSRPTSKSPASLRVAKPGFQGRQPRVLPGSFTTRVCSALSHTAGSSRVCVAEGWHIFLQKDLESSKPQMNLGLWRCVKGALACQGRATAGASLEKSLGTSFRLLTFTKDLL